MKGGSAAGLALQPDPPSVLLDNSARDVQAQAHSGKSAIVNIARAMESLEDERLILDGNSDPVIVNAQPSLAFRAAYGHMHG